MIQFPKLNTARFFPVLSLLFFLFIYTGCDGLSDPEAPVDNPADYILSVSPERDSTEESLFTSISVTFTRDMDSGSLTGSKFQVFDSEGTPVAGTVEYDEASRTATLLPGDKLMFDTENSAILSAGIRTTKGENLPGDYPWSFNTCHTLDILFLIDVSGTFSNGLSTMKTISNGVITSIKAMVPDVQFGITVFSDFPFSPFGNYTSPDTAYSLRQILTTDPITFYAAMNSVVILDGNDEGGSLYEALYQSATHEGLNVSANVQPISYMIPATTQGWRTNALKLIIVVTNSPAHPKTDYDSVFTGSHGSEELLEALSTGEINVLAVQIGTDAQISTQLSEITNGSFGKLYTIATTSGLSTSIITAVSEMLGG